MFGSGSTPGFGGFGTATSTTPFNSSAFNKPAAPAFGQPAAAPAAAAPSVFGSGTTGFGAATPAFGATAAAPATGFGAGFGAATSSASGVFGGTGGLFGAPRTQPAPLFGSGTSSFGAPAAQTAKPGFSFGGGGSSVFGQSAPPTGTATVFGAAAPAFGTTAAGGTTVKFNPPTGTDTMVKNNSQVHINTRFMCIVTMKEYDSKSLEELRMEDYAANRKGPQAGGGFGQPSGGLFGSTAASSGAGGLFGAAQSKPLFGAASTPATGGLFGAAPQPATSGLFGAKPAFGAPTTSAGTGFTFGQAAPATGGLFGTAQTASKPLFGGAATPAAGGGLFGAPASQPAPAFGSTLGSQPAAGGLFGATPATSSGFSFGTPAATSAGGALFGAKPAGFGGFGQPAAQPAASGFSFGAAAAKPGFSFGPTTGSTFGAGSGSLFGAQTKPAAPAFGGFGTGFGGAAPAAPLAGFGAAAQQPSLLGAPPAQQPAAQQLQQHILTLTANPFGDLSLFRNLTKANISREEVLRPTNPQAQRAATEAAPYKVSPRLVSRLTPRPVQAASGTSSLFDGLDDDGGEAEDSAVLVPRRRVKKLELTARPAEPPGPTATAAAEPQQRPTETEPATLATPIPHGASSRLRVTFGPDTTLDSPDIIRGGQLSAAAVETSCQEADDSVGPLQARRAAAAAAAASESFSLDDTVSEDGDEVAAAVEGPPLPAGVRLHRPGYYTLPPLESLTAAADGSLSVEDLTIGRRGYGSAFFPGITQLAGLDLDSIVVFRRREICIYPDDALKPPLGQGLNKPAQVTLERVWPTDKASREPILEPERLARMGWEQRLERACLKLGASFVEYRPETGSWVFKVDHFSKYGLNDSDEEDAASPVVAARAPKPPFAVGAAPAVLAPPPPDGRAPPESAAEKVMPMVESSVPADPASPAVRLARSAAVDSEKVQDMKVFFMDEDEGIEDDGGSQPEEEPFPVATVLRPDLMTSSAASAAEWEMEEGPQPESRPGGGFIETETAQLQRDRSAMDGCPLLASQPHRRTAPIVPRHINLLTPLAKSTRAEAGLLLADLGSSCGGRWRLGWGPGWQLAASAGAGAVPAVTSGLLQPTAAHTQPPLTEYAALLAVQLRFSECEVPADADWPLFSTRPDGALQETLAHTHTQAGHVWGLVVALWGRSDLSLPAAETTECAAHAERQRRRETLSRWLEKACLPAAQRELQLHLDQDYLQTIFTYLTVRQVAEAARVAQRHGDLALSLLLTQLTGSHEVRQLARAQLTSWRQTGADLHMSPARLRLYLVAAGLPVWQAGGVTVNLCSGLDWRRALAIHLWYLSPATASVPEVLAQYDAAWAAEEGCAPLAPPPLPAYLSSEPEEPQTAETAPRDVCHHLLRLYAQGGGRLESLLTPATHTDQPLDHLLSWLLMQSLAALGYRQLSEETAAQLHRCLAAQLEALGLWHLAVFVLLHITDHSRRSAACSALLLRHTPLPVPEDVRRLLLDSFGVPPPALSYAQAVRARALGRRRDEVELLLQAERWQEGHDLLVQHIAPECVINEEYAALGQLLAPLAPPMVSSRVSGWEAAGQLYLDYIAVSRAVDEVLSGRAAADQLQQLRPQLSALSRRLPQLPCPTATHRLAQAEMAKKAATLLRALVSGGGSAGAAAAALLAHVSQLPLPEDAALSEMQDLLRTYLLELHG